FGRGAGGGGGLSPGPSLFAPPPAAAPVRGAPAPARPAGAWFPPPPDSALCGAFPVRVSPRAPPMTFSIVAPDERVSVSPALTACAAGLARLTATARVVVAEKSSVSTPPPDSSMHSLPLALSASHRYMSLPAPPVS